MVHTLPPPTRPITKAMYLLRLSSPEILGRQTLVLLATRTPLKLLYVILSNFLHSSLNKGQAYNPHIFLRDTHLPISTSNICSVVALGADDRSVSVWQTKSARPLIVAKEVFERQIMDLSWYVPSLFFP